MFRQKALDALNNPEKLDQPFQLIRPTFWVLLLSMSGFSLFLLSWSIFGRIPVRISGKGILVEANSTQSLQSEQAGRLSGFLVKIGDCVKKGQAVAKVDPEDYRLKTEKLESELKALKEQSITENALANNQLDIPLNDLNRLRPYRGQGAITDQTFIEKEVSLGQLKARLESEKNSRNNLILNKQLELNSTKKEELSKTSITAPRNGCVSDISAQIGQFIQAGSMIMELSDPGINTNLDSLAYFSPGDGKRIKIDQGVQITPVTTKSQRHGGIEGKVISIKELPVSRESLMIRLGSASIVDSIFSGSSKETTPLIEVRTSLRKDPKTLSGYYWGGGQGPDLKMTPGTPTELRVLVEGRQPISYLVPLLRDLSGIY